MSVRQRRPAMQEFVRGSFPLIAVTILLLSLKQNLNADVVPPPLDCTTKDGADAASVRSAQMAWAKYLGEDGIEKSFPLDRDGKVRIEMILIPPGRYFRGEGKNAVAITLTRPLWVGKYEVTQQQYAAVAGRNPSHFDQEDTSAYPVDAVSHRQAIAFCERANLLTDGEFRLPTEAEWEYAYRAGTRTIWYNGDDETKVEAIAQFGENNRKRPAKLGSRTPNAFGLHDMAGNLWEIVSTIGRPVMTGAPPSTRSDRRRGRDALPAVGTGAGLPARSGRRTGREMRRPTPELIWAFGSCIWRSCRRRRCPPLRRLTAPVPMAPMQPPYWLRNAPGRGTSAQPVMRSCFLSPKTGRSASAWCCFRRASITRGIRGRERS